MKISTTKTEVLHLSRNPDQCVLQVNGATLKQVEKFKYLGVAFTSDGRQDEELDIRTGKASASSVARGRGVFRGGHWAMAPSLGCQGSIISVEKCAKLWHGPLFVSWAEGLSSETVGEDLFLAKNRTKFE